MNLPQLDKLSPAQQKRLLLGVLAALGLAGWLFLFFLPQQRAWGEARGQVEELKRRLADTRANLEQKPAMEQEIARLSSEYGSVEASLPPQEQLPQLLEAIAQTARRAQVHFYGAKPESDINKLSPGLSGYLEPIIMVVVMGGYHQMGAFVDALEQSDLLIRVRELFILGSDPKDMSQHAVMLLLQAYLAPAPPGQAGS